MDSLQARFVGKFYGPYEIKDVKVRSDGVLTLSLDDGKDIPCTEKSLVAIVSDERKDHNHIRYARFNVLVPEMINVIEEYDIPVSDINALLQDVAREVDARFARATNWLWTRDDNRYVPGFNPMEDITLIMAKEITNTIPKHDTGGSASVETTGDRPDTAHS